MSSLRPQESIRKAIAAGYGNPAAGEVGSSKDDGTYQLCQTNFAVELGDWVTVRLSSEGHPYIREPSGADEDPAEWVGVVQHRAAADEWVRVKTAGTSPAKVDVGTDDETVEKGDMLEVFDSTSARKQRGPDSCGRFMYRFSGTPALAMVMIGGSKTSLTVHHHTDEKNSYVVDTTPTTPLRAPLWHILKVVDVTFTGTPAPKLMVALGGGATHGETNEEGWGWAGVIGTNGTMGWGEIGGNEVSGHQGVLGAESADASGSSLRINVRSWAGFNAKDRFGAAVSAVVAPIRFTYKAGEGPPKWYVPDGCDAIVGMTPSEECGTGVLWWAGTMKLDPSESAIPWTATSWAKQWTPQLRVERDCCDIPYVAVTPPDFPCTIWTSVTTLENNAKDATGAYESIVPFGYTKCPNRLSTVQGLCYHALQIRSLWRAIMGFSGWVSQMFACVDTKLVALGQAPCCGTVPNVTAPTVTGGPNASTCAGTECDS